MDQEPILEHFHKQPSEQFYVCGDFVDMLESGETIVLATSTITAVDDSDNDVSTTILDQSTKRIQDTTKLSIKVQGGTVSASPYKITFKAITSLGAILEVDVEMRIKEI